MAHSMVVIAVLFLLGLLSGCTREPDIQGPRVGTKLPGAGKPVFSFAVHPLHNPAKLIAAYQPLIDYLNSNMQGAHLSLEASRDYASFEQKYLARKPAFILPNPWQTLQAEKAGYHVIAMAGEPGDFTGIFIVRRDSGIKTPADLKGKAVSYPSPSALAACIMPQYFLHTHGIDVTKAIENRYVGSQESSIMNVYLGKTAAGATWPVPWRAFQREHPAEAAQLKMLWETEPLINNSVMARNDMPPQLVAQVQQLLLNLEQAPGGKAILLGMETARFLPADNARYELVRAYVARFERNVRPVEAP